MSLALLAAAMLAACGADLGAVVKRDAFSSREYGVAVSPRVYRGANPPRGGGRYMVGRPYQVHGRWFTPTEDPDYVATGRASWYGSDFHGRLTANGEIFSANAITGAHPTLPLPSYVRVTNLENGRSVLVRINDRGPFLQGRLIDLSHRAAEILGFVSKGSAQVQVRYVGAAPLNGDDTRFLMASINTPTAFERQQQGIRVAAAPAGNQDAIGALLGDTLAYAQSRAMAMTTAAAAAEALATGVRPIEPPDAVDAESRRIRVQLGVFADAARAHDVALAFALLGAVDQDQAQLADGRIGVVLTLTYLKPGVTRDDVVRLIVEVGLTDVIPF